MWASMLTTISTWIEYLLGNIYPKGYWYPFQTTAKLYKPTNWTPFSNKHPINNIITPAPGPMKSRFNSSDSVTVPYPYSGGVHVDGHSLWQYFVQGPLFCLIDGQADGEIYDPTVPVGPLLWGLTVARRFCLPWMRWDCTVVHEFVRGGDTTVLPLYGSVADAKEPWPWNIILPQRRWWE